MTTPSSRLGADFISAAAAPIADALAAIRELPMPTADVLISYTARGCIVRVADHRAQHREVVESAFQEAFIAAGWSVAYRLADGLGLQHPARR
ncbi:hypothetical protein [Streptomyces sp. NBC_01205]|uniref:hypothetical protein n=1 Tax=Streptomyces sp. NBC_01205 TaxID=2903771 RepID=UPI002E14CDA2|nr:hypothetical protein OG573_43315 [Streptomyces sp. NBC_01205]